MSSCHPKSCSFREQMLTDVRHQSTKTVIVAVNESYRCRVLVFIALAFVSVFLRFCILNLQIVFYKILGRVQSSELCECH